MTVERLAEKSATNVLESIEGSKHRPLANVIFALGIDHIGGETGAILAERYGSLDALLDAPEEEIAAIPRVGPVRARQHRALARPRPENRRWCDKLLAAGVEPGAAALGAGRAAAGRPDASSSPGRWRTSRACRPRTPSRSWAGRLPPP